MGTNASHGAVGADDCGTGQSIEAARTPVQMELKELKKDVATEHLQQIISHVMDNWQEDHRPALTVSTCVQEHGGINAYIGQLYRISVYDLSKFITEFGRDEKCRLKDVRICTLPQTEADPLSLPAGIHIQLAGKDQPLTIFDVPLSLLEGPEKAPSTELIAKFKSVVKDSADYLRVLKVVASLNQHECVTKVDILPLASHYRILASCSGTNLSVPWKWLWKVFSECFQFLEAKSTFFDFEQMCLVADVLMSNKIPLPRPEFNRKRKTLDSSLPAEKEEEEPQGAKKMKTDPDADSPTAPSDPVNPMPVVVEEA